MEEQTRSAYQGWPRWQVLAAIHNRGMTLSQLALRNNRSVTTFSHVWKRPNRINEKIIADFLGIKPEEIWPDRYPKDSHLIYDSRRYGPAQSQKCDFDSNMGTAA